MREVGRGFLARAGTERRRVMVAGIEVCGWTDPPLASRYGETNGGLSSPRRDSREDKSIGRSQGLR